MKRIFIYLNILMVLLVVLLVAPTNSVRVQANGVSYIDVTTSGTLVGMDEGSGFNLLGRSGLIALAEYVNNGNGLYTSGVSFRLLNDSGSTDNIVDGSGLEPIGTQIDTLNNTTAFYGDLDGSGITIINLSITPIKSGANDVNGVGLFGWTIGSDISNVTISGVSISLVDADFVGGLIGSGSGITISNSSILGNLSIIASGFVGSPDITGIGGLVGRIENSTISNNHINANQMEIVGDTDLGGLVGRSIASIISSGYIEATSLSLSSLFDSDDIGGFVGQLEGSSEIHNSYLRLNSLNVFGDDDLGGFVGVAELSTIVNSYGDIVNLIITGDNNLGTFIGRNDNDAYLSQSFIKARDIFIDGQADGDNLGGFVGSNQGFIDRSYTYTENLIISGLSRIGGFVGINGTNYVISNSFLNVENLTITGIVSGSPARLGGFNGYNNSGIISNSFSVIENIVLSGVGSVGGSIGFLENGVIRQIFSTTKDLTIISDNEFGSFVGSGTASVSNAFFNSGITDAEWINYADDTSSNLGLIDGAALLAIVNGSGAFELIDNLKFPVLKTSGVITREVQPSTTLFWTLGASTPSPDPSTPSVSLPSTGQTYTYDPVFLTIEVEEALVEVGDDFEITYRGYSTFGPIIRDYTELIEVTGEVNTEVVGQYTLTLTLTAEGLTLSETITVDVVDTQAPVITGPSSVELFINQSYDSMVEASDNTDPNVVITQLTEIDPSQASTQEVVWQAIDQYGNTSTFTQTVMVVRPEVRVEEVEVNNQQFVFIISEDEFDFEEVQVEYVVSINEPTMTSNWQPYTGSVEVSPGERVYLRMSDGSNTTVVRQTVAIPDVVETRQPVVYPEMDETSSNGGWIIITVGASLLVLITGWWFIIGKRRRNKEEEQENHPN